jgi:peptide chain release factor 1
MRFTRITASCAVFSCDIVDQRPGYLVFETIGKGAWGSFKKESGGHRWQRVPPSEKHGRRHTSTVTVAVFPMIEESAFELNDADIEEEAILGTGPGGQARNKTANVIRATHKPTGITVRASESRSQWSKRQAARRLLESRVASWRAAETHEGVSQDRREQIGTGQRGDKVRTIRLQDGHVIDHRSKKRTTTTRYLKGHIEDVT